MRTDDVNVRVGPCRIIVAVVEGEGGSVLVIKFGLGADASEAPRSVGPMEYRRSETDGY